MEKAEHGRKNIAPAATILDVRRANDLRQQQSYRINQDMPLLTLDLLARVVAIEIDPGPLLGALNALTVDHADGASGLAPYLPAEFDVEGVMDFPRSSVVLPALEVTVQSTPEGPFDT